MVRDHKPKSYLNQKIKERNVSKKIFIHRTLISVNTIFHCAFLRVFFFLHRRLKISFTRCWFEEEDAPLCKSFFFGSLFLTVCLIESRCIAHSFTTVCFMSSGWLEILIGSLQYWFYYQWKRIIFEKLNNHHETVKKLLDGIWNLSKWIWVH